MLKKNGVDPNSVGVIGIGLGATAVAAMEQGSDRCRDHARSGRHACCRATHKDLKILADTRTQKDTLDGVRRRISGRRALYPSRLDREESRRKCRR